MVWLTEQLDMTIDVDWDVKPQNKPYYDMVFVIPEEQYDMDLQDINFEDEVDGEQSQQEIKQEVTSIKPEEEKFR